MLQTYERKAGVDSNNVDIVGGTQTVDIANAIDTGIALSDAAGIEIDTSPVYDTKALDLEHFMRDIVEVHLHDAPSEDDPQFAEISVNGDKVVALRGESCKMRRYHLAQLAQAKQLRLVQTKTVQPDGSMGYAEKAVMRLSYPFSVTHDPSPKGGAWLKQMLGNPG